MNISEENSNHQRRIVIQKIVLDNFKSYKGQKVIGPFHHRFSCIIGPNGSGKSNLVDSLVFVFGKKAAWMRVKYLRELIHNSDNQDCSQASVTVYFQEIIDSGDESIEYIEGSQFSITRSVNLKSESTFFLNDKKMTQKKIIELLKTKKIDLEKNRFMILQGEVEQIALMKPKTGNIDNPGLLEYLEDIIGSDQYVESIEQLQQELESFSFKRIESNDKMYAMKQKVSDLRKKKDKAILYLEREKFVFQLKNFLEQVQMFHIRHTVKENQNIKLKFLKDQENLNKEMKNQVQEYDKQIKKVQAFKKKLDEKDKELKKVDESVDKLKEEYNQTVNNSKRISFQRQELIQEIENLDTKKSRCINDMGDLKNQLQELNTRLNAQQNEHDILLVNIEKLKPQYESDIKDIEQQINAKEKIILQIKQEKNINEQLKNQHDEQVQELKRQIQENKDTLEIQKMEYNKVKERITQAHENAKEAQREEKALENILQKNEKNLSEIQSEAKNILNNIKDLERNIETFQQQNNRRLETSRIHQKLMDAQVQGKLSGLIGRFGDLIAIKNQYAVPICTVAEAHANSMIVRTTDDAQRALHFLKVNRIGQMKFWALDKVKNLQQIYDKQFDTPAQSIRIFDTLKYDDTLHPNFKSLLYRIFNDILITKDIKSAKFLAYEDKVRREVVTLDGSHINKHGMLSKKQHQNSDLFTNSLNRDPKQQQNITELEQKLFELQKDFSEKSLYKNKVEKTINENSEKKNNFKDKVDFYNAKYNEFKENLKELDESKLDLDLKIKTTESKLKDLQDNYDYESVSDNLTGLKNKLQKEEKQRDKLQQKKLKIGSDEFQSFMQQFDKLEKDIDELNKLINEAEGQKTFQEKECQKYIQKQEDSREELQKREIEQEEAKKQINQLIQKAGQVNNQREQLLQQKNEIEKELDSFSGELDDLDKYIREKKIIMKQIKEQVDRVQEDIDYNKNKLKKFYENLDAIRQNYETSRSQYEFLNQIDEIEQLEKDKDNQNDVKHEKENEQSENSDEEKEEKNSRGRPRRNQDLQFVKQVDVLEEYQDDILQQYQNKDQILMIQNNIKTEEDSLKQMAPYLDVLKKYKDQLKDYIEKLNYHEKVKKKEEELQKQLFDLKDKRKFEFSQGLQFISKKMKEIYKSFAKGGDAELESLETSNPFSKGIVFSVKPHKTWSSISVLSGGQKTLVSLSFIYALHYYKPNSIYFMDEIDAALDYKNRGLVGEFIKTRTKEAQFIVISLRNEMFEKSDLLVDCKFRHKSNYRKIRKRKK